MVASVGRERNQVGSLSGVQRTTATVRSAAGPCRELLEAGQADEGGLNLHILQSQIVVWQVQRLADDDPAFLTRLRRDLSLGFDLLCGMLVFLVAYGSELGTLTVAGSRFPLFGKIFRELVDFRLESLPEVLERDDNDCDIVEGAFSHG